MLMATIATCGFAPDDISLLSRNESLLFGTALLQNAAIQTLHYRPIRLYRGYAVKGSDLIAVDDVAVT